MCRRFFYARTLEHQASTLMGARAALTPLRPAQLNEQSDVPTAALR